MASGIDVGISDDYAVLQTEIGTFYFGYESAREVDGEDEDAAFEWRFTYTTPRGEEVCALTLAELGIEGEYGYDDAAAVVLYGIGYCIQQGWIKQGEV